MEGRVCTCGAVARAALSDEYPIVFDAETNEYHMVFGPPAKQGRAMVRYCWSCGGELPLSRRGELFLEPDPVEVSLMQKDAQQFKSATEMRDAWGYPDEICEGENSTRQYTYSSRFRTINVLFFLNRDGSFTFEHHGKQKKRGD